jgi:hypothetical protein
MAQHLGGIAKHTGVGFQDRYQYVRTAEDIGQFTERLETQSSKRFESRLGFMSSEPFDAGTFGDDDQFAALGSVSAVDQKRMTSCLRITGTQDAYLATHSAFR